MSHSVCLNIGLSFRALSKKRPHWQKPKLTFFKHCSQLIYTLLFFKKLIRKKKKSRHGLESRLSVLLKYALSHPDKSGARHRNTQIPFFASLLFVACFLCAIKGYMHLSAPRNRYMHTTASKGRMLFMKVTMYMRRGVQIMGWSVRMAFIACFTQ